MKGGFYIKLAKDGILKNRKFYFPYIITCICMIAMFYIVSYLSDGADFSQVTGGDMLQGLLAMGKLVIAVFSLIFLYYTNSFLTRRRQKEFGLYNILGMGKRNLVKILIWENVLNAFVSIVMGLVFGFLFSKLAELGAMKLLGGQTGFGITIEMKPVLYTVTLFLTIFALIMVRMLISIFRLRPVEMLRSENVGEKPPKANWILAFAGAVLLGGAYYMAVTIINPASAMILFFWAVILVIVATYLLFIAGSVVLCRLLQKNKKYYYKTKHFVSLSSMVYRMKRNGAGLASICILSTMVLVTVSSTACLYAQTEESVEKRYPYDINLSMSSGMEKAIDRSQSEVYIQAIDEILEKYGETAQNVEDFMMYRNYGIQKEDQIQLDYYEDVANGKADFVNMIDLYFITDDDYSRLTGKNCELAEDQMLLFPYKMNYDFATVTLDDLGTWEVQKLSEQPFSVGGAEANMNGSLFLVVNDISLIEQIQQSVYKASQEYGGYFAPIQEEYGFDLDCGDEKQREIYDDIFAKLSELGAQDETLPDYYTESKAQGKMDTLGINGGLFFLGILLGAVFLFGTVLIMYYKQISEGYEDQNRFDILMKVGMTRREVKRSINSQVLTVFFLPLITAGVHLAFAFPLISKIMLLLSAAATKEMLMAVTACCYLIFAVFYVIVYWMTSKSYYTIISSKDHR